MTRNELFELYNKEREYQESTFGVYSNNPSLNFASFILFLEEYVGRMRNAYKDKWDKRLPPWLIITKEFEDQGSAPSKAYEELIKIFVLAGAALESYSIVSASIWREEGETKEKWIQK